VLSYRPNRSLRCVNACLISDWISCFSRSASQRILGAAKSKIGGAFEGRSCVRVVEQSTQQTDDWKQETVTFAAAYGNERIVAYLYFPKKATPPFQTVVYFPGAGAIRTRSSANLSPGYLDDFDFILRSGRAVMVPLYKATFERGDDTKNGWPNTTSSYKDHVIAWSKDLGRSVDYLETRPDIDHNKLAYEGYSWGAAMGALLPAIEDRLKALVLIAPGFYLQHRLPKWISSTLPAGKSPGSDVEWPLRFHLPNGLLTGAHVPSARNTHRAQASCGLRYRPRYSPE
jgi:dienelactone hydrolase